MEDPLISLRKGGRGGGFKSFLHKPLGLLQENCDHVNRIGDTKRRAQRSIGSNPIVFSDQNALDLEVLGAEAAFETAPGPLFRGLPKGSINVRSVSKRNVPIDTLSRHGHAS